MQQFELNYAAFIRKIMEEGELRKTRNAVTKSLFGHSLEVDTLSKGLFPILQGRQMFLKGIKGEFAAIIRQPTHIQDFKKWGCFYWDKWARADGSLTIDYGNAWFNFNGFNQIEALKQSLKCNSTDRRMIVSGWRPDRLHLLSLPCCHYSYQFYVRQDKYLDMVWTQRSVDVMVGLPSDIAFAAIWVITLANEFGLVPGRLKFDFGDCHIYEPHFDDVETYLEYVSTTYHPGVFFSYTKPIGAAFEQFEPSDLELINYAHGPKIKFELLA